MLYSEALYSEALYNEALYSEALYSEALYNEVLYSEAPCILFVAQAARTCDTHVLSRHAPPGSVDGHGNAHE